MEVTFNKKGTIFDINSGEDIINICSSPLESMYTLEESTIFTVGEEYAGRIDKFCSDKVLPSGYDPSSIDTILYLNELINPFCFCGEYKNNIFSCSYSENDFTKEKDITFPDHSETKEVEEFKERTKEVTNKLKSKPDTNRKDRLQRLAQSRSNGVKEITTSNMIQPGQIAKIYNNNKIILGGNILQTK